MRQEITNAENDGEKRESLVHCWWDCKLAKPLWKTLWGILKKIKIELPYDLAIPLLGILSEGNKNTRSKHPQAHSSITYNSQNNLSVYQWMNKKSHIVRIYVRAYTYTQWNIKNGMKCRHLQQYEWP